MNTVHSINAVGWKSVLFIVCAFLLPMLITLFAIKFAGGQKSLAVAGIIGVIVLPLFLFLFVQLFLVSARVSGHSLTVGGGLYSVTVPFTELRIEEAQVARELPKPLALSYRTNGIGMPGLALGWYKSTDGQKVFAAITDPSKAVLVPTSRGYVLYLSPSDPEIFVRDLKAASDAAR